MRFHLLIPVIFLTSYVLAQNKTLTIKSVWLLMSESLSELTYLRFFGEISEDNLDISFDYYADEHSMSQSPPEYYTVSPSRFRRFMYKPPDSVPEVKNDNPFPDEPTVENNPWMLEPSFNEHFEQLRYWEMAYGEWYDTCYLDGTLRMSVTFITMRDRKMYTGVIEIPSNSFTKLRYGGYRIRNASLAFTLTLEEERAGNEYLQ